MSNKALRGNDKTTNLFEEAVRLLAELPEGYSVFLTGAHSRWLSELKYRVRRFGLVDVHVFTVEEIKYGKLRGRRGVLLVDDVMDMSYKDAMEIRSEQAMLFYSIPPDVRRKLREFMP